MRDAITGLIGRYDQLGRYLDRAAIDRISNYFSEAELRLRAVELINREATDIVREASQRLWMVDPELILPGGNAYSGARVHVDMRDKVLSEVPGHGSHAKALRRSRHHRVELGLA